MDCRFNFNFLIPRTGFGSRPSDIKGNWAEGSINSWISKGFVKGYSDGTFRPNGKVSREEFSAFVNRSFGYSERGTLSFTDVASSSWAYQDISIAKAAGYISGYVDGTFRPKNEISRQEAAAMVFSILNLENSSSADLYADTINSPQWSKSSIGAVIDHGIMVGYTDNTFRPGQAITRAEAIVVLERAFKVKSEMATTTTYDAAGTYGPISGVLAIKGNVVISAQDVTLQNVTISGNLLLAETIGEGDVFLKNVTVMGHTTVNGGGENSIHVENSVLGTVTVNKPTGSVRIVASGTTFLGEITLQSSSILEETNLTGKGFGDVILSELLPDGSKVIVTGKFDKVNVNANNAILDIPAGSSVDSLIMNGAGSVTGQGTIRNVQLNQSGASVQQIPTNIVVAAGVIATVGGIAAVSTPIPTSTPTPAPIPNIPSNAKAITVFNFGGLHPVVVGAINEVTSTISLSVPFGTDVTALLPSIASSGISISPSAGTLNNFISPATYTVTAENGTAQAYVVTVIAASTVAAGANVTINAPAEGITAWLAPAGTVNFTATAADKTKLVGDGTASVIVAPTALGEYNLFLVNSDDPTDVSLAPVGILTVVEGSTEPVNLGVSANFAILAKTGVSTVPESTVTGNIGVSPASSTAITGFGLTLGSAAAFSTSEQVVGQVFAPDYALPTPSVLTTAISDMETAYTDAAGRAPNYTELLSGNISGQTLAPGVYKWGTSVRIDSGKDVTLDGGANDVWVFQIAGGFTQASATRIILSGGAKPENIFWQIADTVAIGTTAHFEGVVLGQKEIAIGTGASVNGRLLSQTAVTLNKSTIVVPASATDSDKVAIAKVNLSLGDLSAVTENIILPVIQDDAAITWLSNKQEVLNNEGEVIRPIEDTVVTLTATIEAGSEIATKSFVVTVKGMQDI